MQETTLGLDIPGFPVKERATLSYGVFNFYLSWQRSVKSSINNQRLSINMLGVQAHIHVVVPGMNSIRLLYHPAHLFCRLDKWNSQIYNPAYALVAKVPMEIYIIP